MHNTQRTVFVVEDDKVIRESLEELLTDEGYRVVAAADGLAALTLLRAGERPGLMLLDLMMPIMDGWQLWDTMQRDGDLARIPVVVVSAARERPPVGVLQCIPKPIPLDRLLATIDAHCGSLSLATPL